MSRSCRRGLAAIVVGALTLGAAAAAPVVQTATPGNATQTSHDVMRGTFTQRKYLADLDQPLVSSGRYVVAADHGLIWRIKQPIQAQLVISRQRLVRSSDRHEITRIDADQQPALHIVAAVLLAVFQADTDKLRQYFDIQKQTPKKKGGDGRWAMTLRPKSAAVAEFVDHVRVRGQATPKHIEIYQPGGDHTEIDLQPTSGGPDTLSAAERAEFLH